MSDGGATIFVDSRDSNGNPTSVTDNGVTTVFTYNPDGTPHTQTRDGVTRTYTYANGQLVSVS
jgi:YD repeat-containing protein